MSLEELEQSEGDGLPASMADLFFALAAIIVFLLLALVPMIGPRPPATATAAADDLWRAPVRVDNRNALVFVAGARGLRLAGAPGRTVPLDAILDDAPLAAQLREAGGGKRPVLLAIEPDGGEAAFLFDALAGSLALPEIVQLRVEADCGHLLESQLRGLCRARTTAGPR